MRNRKDRGFPYPVISEERDDMSAKFTVDLISRKQDASNLNLSFSAAVDSMEIQELIRDRKASYILHAECSKNYFREARMFYDQQYEVSLPLASLSGRLNISFVIAACDAVSDYHPFAMHSDYGTRRFPIPAGGILALGPVFPIELREICTLQNMSSLISVRDRLEPTGTMYINFEKDKIVVLLNQPDFAQYVAIRKVAQLRFTLLNSIVTPALTEAIQYIRDCAQGEETDMESERDTKRWFRSVELMLRSANEPPEKTEKESLELAQLILKTQFISESLKELSAIVGGGEGNNE